MFKQIRNGALLSLVMAAMCLSPPPQVPRTGRISCSGRREVHGLPRRIGLSPALRHRQDEARDPGRRPRAGLHQLPRRERGPRRRQGQAGHQLRPAGCVVGGRAERGLPELPPEGHRASPVGGSTHEAREVACASCHNVHSGHDKVLDKLSQPESATPATRASASRRTSPGTIPSSKARWPAPTAQHPRLDRAGADEARHRDRDLLHLPRGEARPSCTTTRR